MINVKSALFAGVLFVATISNAQAYPIKIPIKLFAPDLIVLEVSSPNLDSGIVSVRVKNQGKAASSPCYMAIRITPLGGSMKVFSPPVPALAAGQEAIVEAHTEFLLSQADYEAIVDRSNTVHESNETNNSLKGKFGGKP